MALDEEELKGERGMPDEEAEALESWSGAGPVVTSTAAELDARVLALGCGPRSVEPPFSRLSQSIGVRTDDAVVACFQSSRPVVLEIGGRYGPVGGALARLGWVVDVG